MAEADYRLMTEATGQRIAAALEALHLATVTGIKGNAEANYRHGDVNLTPANIGALPLTGGAAAPMTGDLVMRKSSPFLIMQDENGIPQVQWIGDTNQHKAVVVERHTGDDNLDFFYFPAPSATGDSAAYDVLSTKNLASIIPTANYDQPDSFESGVTASEFTNNTVRCIKYGNGLKRIIGIFNVTSNRASGKLFTVPSKYSFESANNGSMQQAWGFMGRRGSDKIYIFRFVGREFGADDALDQGTYAVDYLYF